MVDRIIGLAMESVTPYFPANLSDGITARNNQPKMHWGLSETLLVTIALLAAGAALLWLRSAAPARLKTTMIVAIGLLGLACASPLIFRETTPHVVVMIDLSPSTRSAAYRDRTVRTARVRQLLPTLPVQELVFAAEVISVPAADPLPDLPCDRTRFLPPAADAILLFSDGQFALPSNSPPVYAVVDPGLQAAADGSVRSIDFRGNHAVIAVRNDRGGRELRCSGGERIETFRLAPGMQTVTFHRVATPGWIRATLAAGDSWPENDSLTVCPPDHDFRRIWLGEGAPPGWLQVHPSNVPNDSLELLNAAVIALAAPREQFADEQIDCLTRYVRDLGGTLILTGGPHGYAAGGWTGSHVDAMSPLAASPPFPGRHWVILLDASGSMSAAEGASTRFEQARRAVQAWLRWLPPNDLATIGSFSESFRLWAGPMPVHSVPQSIGDFASVTPRGPTNLEAVLQQILELETKLVRVILVITDGETEIGDPAALGRAVLESDSRLLVLAVGSFEPSRSLEELVRTAGGTLTRPKQAQPWLTGLQELGRSAVAAEPVPLRRLMRLAPPIDLVVMIEEFERTWLREGATELASTPDSHRWPLAADWRVGAGRVIGLAFAPTFDLIEKTATVIEAPPNDPRFVASVRWGDPDRLIVEAVDDDVPMNGLSLEVMFDHTTERLTMTQTGPGRYELPLRRVAESRVLSVRLEGTVLRRIAVPDREAVEFDEIGLNRPNLASLVERFGGKVIEPTD
ncbi:MAG: VWA domain-containing protein, partial [Phycisphaerae bacterium]|nr:VWA domain-containing protein [Phycisphaerae bacterium]MDW8262369.1 VWA domain-containing protein [Phycisphaerales bacterium]